MNTSKLITVMISEQALKDLLTLDHKAWVLTEEQVKISKPAAESTNPTKPNKEKRHPSGYRKRKKKTRNSILEMYGREISASTLLKLGDDEKILRIRKESKSEDLKYMIEIFQDEAAPAEALTRKEFTAAVQRELPNMKNVTSRISDLIARKIIVPHEGE